MSKDWERAQEAGRVRTYLGSEFLAEDVPLEHRGHLRHHHDASVRIHCVAASMSVGVGVRGGKKIGKIKEGRKEGRNMRERGRMEGRTHL